MIGNLPPQKECIVKVTLLSSHSLHTLGNSSYYFLLFLCFVFLLSFEYSFPLQLLQITYVTELTPEDEKVRFVLPTTIAPLHKWASNQV